MTKIFDMQPRTAKSHLSWEKQQEIKEARDELEWHKDFAKHFGLDLPLDKKLKTKDIK